MGRLEHVATDDATRTVDAAETVRCDPGRLQQLLENLMHIAIDHGTDHITVTVGVLVLLLGFRLETSKFGVEYRRGTLNSSESATV